MKQSIVTRVPSLEKARRRSAVVLLLAVMGFQAHLLGEPKAPMPPLPEAAPLLWHETFDAPYVYGSTETRVMLPSYGVMNESWSGFALERSGSSVKPFIVPALRADGSLNIATDGSGAIRVWVKPRWSSVAFNSRPGPGNFARLAELTVGRGSRSEVCWSLLVNPEGSMLFLICQNDTGVVELLRTPISWRAGTPHLICLNFGPEGTSLFVDALLVAEGAGTIAVPPALSQISLGSALSGTDTAGADFDEVFSFGRPLTSDELAYYYRANWSMVVSGSLASTDDGTFSLQSFALLAAAATLDSGGPPPPPGGGGCEGGGGGFTNNPPIYTSGLGLCLYPPNLTSSNTLSMSLTNTKPGEVYDLFYTTNLALLPAPALCVTNCQWLQRTTVGQTNIVVDLNALPEAAEAFFRLGTVLDSDADGLTDAFENLVSHTDPLLPDSDFDGLSDYFEWSVLFTDPWTVQPIPTLNSRPIFRCPVP